MDLLSGLLSLAWCMDPFSSGSSEYEDSKPGSIYGSPSGKMSASAMPSREGYLGFEREEETGEQAEVEEKKQRCFTR